MNFSHVSFSFAWEKIPTDLLFKSISNASVSSRCVSTMMTKISTLRKYAKAFLHKWSTVRRLYHICAIEHCVMIISFIIVVHLIGLNYIGQLANITRLHTTLCIAIPNTCIRNRPIYIHYTNQHTSIVFIIGSTKRMLHCSSKRPFLLSTLETNQQPLSHLAFKEHALAR